MNTPTDKHRELAKRIRIMSEGIGDTVAKDLTASEWIRDAFPPQATAPDLEAVGLLRRAADLLMEGCEDKDYTEDPFTVACDIDAYLAKHGKNLDSCRDGQATGTECASLGNSPADTRKPPEHTLPGDVKTDVTDDSRGLDRSEASGTQTNQHAGSNPAGSTNLSSGNAVELKQAERECRTGGEEVPYSSPAQSSLSSHAGGTVSAGQAHASKPAGKVGSNPTLDALSDEKPCPQCKGMGYLVNIVEGRYATVLCPTCRGTGKEPKE